ncbi:MAG: hypothetical protein SVS15_10650 [Thermodesulfobacteriota bacterium]|nr:hypothetical protein [Thermodesulfobacteriota bacterium]
MGRILQIRVLAQTYRPRDVELAWPRLFALAWPEPPAKPDEAVGVLELVTALDEKFQFGSLEPEIKVDLGPGLNKIIELKSELEGALADRRPALADSVSYLLEEALDVMEKSAPEPDKFL